MKVLQDNTITAKFTNHFQLIRLKTPSTEKQYSLDYREDICLQTLLLLFKYANHTNKRSFVSTANEALVCILMTIGDANNIFPMEMTSA